MKRVGIYKSTETYGIANIVWEIISMLSKTKNTFCFGVRYEELRNTLFLQTWLNYNTCDNLFVIIMSDTRYQAFEK